jgi:glycosyltransferase involved in cell wall biosynthesis
MNAVPVTLSLVIPVYNEAESLPDLYRRLKRVLDELGETYEIILVNDGSNDGSLAAMLHLREQDRNVKIVDLSRNWGHQLALSAGLDYARGQAVITMDGDLQHPPEEIPRLVEKWREGYEVVQTVRESTADSGRFKRLTSAWYYGLFRAISQTGIQPGAADFRLLDSRPLAALQSVRERRRFLRGLIPWLGYRTTYVPYAAQRRFAGETKYSLPRMIRLALAGILSFSPFPLRLSLYFGLLLAFLNGIYALYILYAHIFHNATVSGWTSLMLVVLFLSSAQFIILGILGEYVATVVEEVKQRPLYLVRDAIGFAETTGRGAGLPGV